MRDKYLSMRFSLYRSFVIGCTAALALSSCAHLFDNSEKSHEKAKIYIQLAADLYGQKDYNKSIESSLQAIKYDPHYAAAHNHLGIVYMETKRYMKGEEAFRKALEIQSDYPEVYNNMGVLFNRQEKFAEGVTYFEKALKAILCATTASIVGAFGYIIYLKQQLAK